MPGKRKLKNGPRGSRSEKPKQERILRGVQRREGRADRRVVERQSREEAELQKGLKTFDKVFKTLTNTDYIEASTIKIEEYSTDTDSPVSEITQASVASKAQRCKRVKPDRKTSVKNGTAKPVHTANVGSDAGAERKAANEYRSVVVVVTTQRHTAAASSCRANSVIGADTTAAATTVAANAGGAKRARRTG